MQKTVLITGCSGQLGDRLYKDLSVHFKVIPTYRKHQNKEYSLDITSPIDCDYIFSNNDIDVVINCAAITNVDLCEMDKKLCRDVNVAGLNRLIASSKVGAKIIHISSDYVFDGFDGNYLENNLTHPINYYGKSKLESENILIGSNREHLIFRVSTLFDNSHGNFLTWVLNSLKNKKYIRVANDMFSTPTWIPSFSNVITKSIYLDMSGIFHYGSSNSVSRLDFALSIAKEFGGSEDLIKSARSTEFNFSAKRPLNTSLNSDKISDYIGVDNYDTKYILKLINKAS